MFFYSESETGDNNTVALPTSWSQSLKVYDTYAPSGTGNQGLKSTAVSGDGSVVFFGINAKAVNGASAAGEVYVYEKVSNVWTKTATVTETTSGSSHYFGYTLSTNHDGTILAVGTRDDVAYIFKKINGNWVETDSFTGNNHFGREVSLSGNGMTLTIVDGAYYSNEYYKVNIYENTNDAWALVKTAWGMTGLSPNEYIRPISISYDGSIVAMGGPVADSWSNNNRGYAYMFEKNNNWGSQTITPPPGTPSNEQFGRYVDISPDGTTMAVGTKETRRIHIYKKVDNVWTLDSTIPRGTSYSYSSFGDSFALSTDGSLLAVSAPKDVNQYSDVGQILFYKQIDGVWEVVHNQWPDPIVYNSQFGDPMAMSGDGTVVAANGRQNFFIIEGT